MARPTEAVATLPAEDPGLETDARRVRDDREAKRL
jgi:hypothetical protein